ncbi:MAG: hypothetical protein ABW179_03045 [Methylobacterium sp.]
MLDRQADRSIRPGDPASRAVRSSALRASTPQRLAVVAAPIVALWIAVALALDLLK